MALYAFDGTWNEDRDVDERDTIALDERRQAFGVTRVEGAHEVVSWGATPMSAAATATPN